MRVKTGTTRGYRHQRVLKRTKGMRMTKGRLYRVSKEADLHAGQYAYAGRKKRKRDLRRIWISRINAALTEHAQGLKYSHFMSLLKKGNITLNRKILSGLALSDPQSFKSVIEKVQTKLE